MRLGGERKRSSCSWSSQGGKLPRCVLPRTGAASGRIARTPTGPAEIDHKWSWKPGAVGRGLKKHLDAETWNELASTYVGADIDENWDALFKTTALFRRIALEVGHALGYRYPSELDERMTSYLQSIRNLEQ